MPHRFYSMSAEIRKQRKGYYEILEKTQKGGVDVTGWLEWFLDCLEAALVKTEKSISTVLQKAAFWDRYRLVSMNERQIKMVNLLWDGFDGKFTTLGGSCAFLEPLLNGLRLQNVLLIRLYVIYRI